MGVWAAALIKAGANAVGYKKQKEQYTQTQKMIDAGQEKFNQQLKPWSDFGGAGRRGYMGLGDFEFDASNIANEAGYQFEKAEGEQAIQRRAGASGRIHDTSTDLALLKFNSDYASTRVNQAYNRQSSTYQINLQRFNTMMGYGHAADNAIANAELGTSRARAGLSDQLGDVKANYYSQQGRVIASGLPANYGGGGGGGDGGDGNAYDDLYKDFMRGRDSPQNYGQQPGVIPHVPIQNS